MSIKLIALDVDDTLLTSNQKIAESTKSALKEALAKGIKVVLCSGRPLAGVSHYLDELGVQGDDQYVITYNGALVETAAGKVLSRKIINNKDYRRIVKFVEARKMQYYVLDDDSNVYTSNHDINRFAVTQAWENSAGIFVREPDELAPDFEIAKAAIVGEKETLDQYEQAVKDEFSDEYYVVRAGANFIEIMHPEVNKGEGLTTLADILHLSSDEIMAFGDEKNDLPMFDFVGSAVAMGNGSDIAKEHAKYVTDTNDNDGIAKALKKYVL